MTPENSMQAEPVDLSAIIRKHPEISRSTREKVAEVTGIPLKDLIPTDPQLLDDGVRAPVMRSGGDLSQGDWKRLLRPVKVISESESTAS